MVPLRCSPLSSGDCLKQETAEGTECQELVGENPCPCFALLSPEPSSKQFELNSDLISMIMVCLKISLQTHSGILLPPPSIKKKKKEKEKKAPQQTCSAFKHEAAIYQTL